MQEMVNTHDKHRTFLLIPKYWMMDNEDNVIKMITGWWLGHPSEKYEFVNWDDEINPIFMGKFQEWQPNHQPVASSWSLPTRSLRVT